MKHLRETFTDQEFSDLKEAKAKSSKKNWHDFILCLIPHTGTYDFTDEQIEEFRKVWRNRKPAEAVSLNCPTNIKAKNHE